MPALFFLGLFHESEGYIVIKIFLLLFFVMYGEMSFLLHFFTCLLGK
jgi:hypothetical protein